MDSLSSHLTRLTDFQTNSLSGHVGHLFDHHHALLYDYHRGKHWEDYDTLMTYLEEAIEQSNATAGTGMNRQSVRECPRSADVDRMAQPDDIW